ncbi:hypothetical protein [Terrimonas pollutisoli]|uniref:hypothetical protein n=1 Tax=Terrimonas pollutisoli TaxID=3034147 RepID=UPI0023ED5A17|nr:hypothetical protein [Terrimonas sp. H1YJ31]
MEQKIIRLRYRKIIDTASQKLWDKLVFESTYKEFLMQSQFYNQEKKHTTFAALLQHAPGAEKLHFLVSTAIVGYLQQLKGVVPDILNNVGKHFLRFENYRFELINSDIKNKSAHQAAINFFSEPLTWHDTVSNYLLVSQSSEEKTDDGVLTEMVQLQPFLSIYSLKTEEV